MLTPLQPVKLVDMTPQNPDFNPNDPPEVVQLQLDLVNVLEGRVDINTFPKEYQDKMKNYYKFYGIRYCSKYPLYPKMIRETFEVV